VPSEVSEIPLSLLVVDANRATAQSLEAEVSKDPRVVKSTIAHAVKEAQGELRSGNYNGIMIDPMSIGLDVASEFIFSARKSLPEIVFVLFVDSAEIDSRRTEFFSGTRRRFAHYFTLNKRTPVAAFSDEVEATLTFCTSWLERRLSVESLKKIREAVAAKDVHSPSRITPEVRAGLDRAISLATPRLDEPPAQPSVFLSHRFAETEYVDGLTQLLEKEGFVVVIGSPANTYVSSAILQRISEADYFIGLMTRAQEKVDGNFTTSPWLLEEKGAALALQKRIVLLVEHGVDEFGGLQGDWQRIHFGPKGYLSAALQAVTQLKSYTGS
jgi:hypothetical protein